MNILDKSGAWYGYNGNRLGQGKDNVREKLKEDKALMAEIEGKILAQLLPERYEASHAETEANQ